MKLSISLVLGLVSLVSYGQTPVSMSPSAAACGKWTVVKSPDGPSKNNHLYGVSASAANNVWAVGSYLSGNPINGPFKTLTERWNGSAWSFVPSADAGAEDALGGVAAISPTDMWAVGDFMPQLRSPQTAFIEHWNGQKWSVVPSPRPGQLSGLSSVRAVSAADVWAVGSYYNNAGNSQTLIEHWNGKKWRIVPSPSPGLSDNYLGGLEVVSATDIWGRRRTVQRPGQLVPDADRALERQDLERRAEPDSRILHQRPRGDDCRQRERRMGRGGISEFSGQFRSAYFGGALGWQELESSADSRCRFVGKSLVRRLGDRSRRLGRRILLQHPRTYPDTD
jgi:hypothetical protein